MPSTATGLLPQDPNKTKTNNRDFSLSGLGAAIGSPFGVAGTVIGAVAPGAVDAVNNAVDNATSGTAYNYKPQPGTVSNSWRNAEKTYQNTADDTSGYASALNNGVASESNLLGPQDESTPANQALSARANQIYQSNVNKIARQAQPMATQATTQLQTQDLAHRAAMYSNEQSQAQINFQQAAFQRSAAIQMANMKNQMYNALFGGVAQIGGAGMAMISSGGGESPAVSPTAPAPVSYANPGGGIYGQAAGEEVGGPSFVGPMPGFNGPIPQSQTAMNPSGDYNYEIGGLG